MVFAREKSSGYDVALKIVNIRKVEEDNHLMQVRSEIEIQHRLRHPNITKLFCYFYDEENIYMVME